MKVYVILRYGDKILKLLLLASMIGDFFYLYKAFVALTKTERNKEEP